MPPAGKTSQQQSAPGAKKSDQQHQDPSEAAMAKHSSANNAAAANNDDDDDNLLPPEPNLCDLVVDSLTQPPRNPERPVLSRMVIIGEIASKDDPPKAFFEDLILKATATVNAADPLRGRLTSASSGSATAETVSIVGIFAEMQHHFFQLLESEPEHLTQVMREVNHRLNVAKNYDAIKNVHVAMYSDDIAAKSCPKWVAMDAAMPNAATNTVSKSTPLEDLIVDATHGLMALGKMMHGQRKVQMDEFVSNIRTTHTQQLPKAALVERCLDSGLCLTLEEYLELFGAVPAVTRPNEVVEPVEPPLNY